MRKGWLAWFKRCLPLDVEWASITHSHSGVLQSKNRTLNMTYFTKLLLCTQAFEQVYLYSFDFLRIYSIVQNKNQNNSFLVQMMTPMKMLYFNKSHRETPHYQKVSFLKHLFNPKENKVKLRKLYLTQNKLWDDKETKIVCQIKISHNPQIFKCSYVCKGFQIKIVLTKHSFDTQSINYVKL